MKHYLRGSSIRQYALADGTPSGAVFQRDDAAAKLAGKALTAELKIEQVRLLYGGLPSALANNILLALMLVYVLWPVASHEKLSGWLAAITLTLLVRMVLAVAWLHGGAEPRGGTRTEHAVRVWLNRFRASAIATGLAWGAGIVLLFPEGDAPHQLFVAFVTGGVSLGAVTLLAVDRVAVLGYLIPMLAPLAVCFGMEEGRMPMAMVAMVALYLAFVVTSAARIGRGFRENILLKNEAVRRNHELNAIVEGSPDNIIRYDLNCRAIYVNGNMEKTVKVAAGQVIGKAPVELEISGLIGAEEYQAMLQHVMDTGEPGNVEVVVPNPAGNLSIHYIHFSAERGMNGNVMGALAFGRDVTKIKAADEKIKQLALYDTLTGLPNRRLMLDRLQHALSSSMRNGKHGALMVIDLDNFKRLNDTQGHGKGDLLLQQVARRLSTCVREGDTMARLGDDEFVVILENMSGQPREAATEAEIISKKILTVLNQSYLLDGYECHNTQSIGIALFDGRQQRADELLKQADLAMHRAKAAGRNGLRFFDPEMQSVITARAALDGDVQRALQLDQLLLHYQPQVNSKGHMTGAEALVRWQHPERGMVMPGDFIPLAEETGLILPIGLWVLKTACEQLAFWSGSKETSRLTMSVNVSARQLLHPNFVGQVMAVIERTGANPNRLKLELTESLLLDNVDETIVKMITLKTRGVKFSLDDFGTGYSSLSYLKLLPLEYLKIDRSFVRDVLTDPNDAAIARTIVALTQSLGLGVIAEGVETEAQRDLLASYGCHTYQGYFFSRPLPANQLEEFLLGGGRR